jgi:hypothetical protein
MAQTSKSFRHLGSGWKPGPRLWKYLKNQLGQDSQFFCGNLGDVRVTEAEMRFHHLGGELTQSVVQRHVLDFWGSQHLQEDQVCAAGVLDVVAGHLGNIPEALKSIVRAFAPGMKTVMRPLPAM